MRATLLGGGAAAAAVAATDLVATPVLPPWAQWLVLIAGVAVAVRTLGRTVVKPLSRVVDIIPMLDELANRFRPNGGESLYDIIHRLDTFMKDIKPRVEHLESIVDPEPPPSDLAAAVAEVVRDVVAEAVGQDKANDMLSDG